MNPQCQKELDARACRYIRVHAGNNYCSVPRVYRVLYETILLARHTESGMACEKDAPKGKCCGKNTLIQWLLEVLAIKRSGLRTLIAVYFRVVEPTVPSLAYHVRSPSYACILRSGHIGLVLLAYALRFLLRPEQWRT